MKKRRLSLLFSLLATVCVTSAVAAERWSVDQIRTILADRVDRDVQAVGIAVGLIDEHGRVVVSYGRRGPDDSRAPDGDTLFEIGSVTKVFTAVLLADMMLKGEVGLDDPVANFLPESVRVPSEGDEEITLYRLSTHTSGLPNMPDNFAPADPANPYADYGVDRMYEFLSGHELARTPGERAGYSNLGVGLLGHALSLFAGSDYETLVRSRITKPLGMKDTVIALSDELSARLAQGHDRNLRPTSNWDLPAFAGAGALRSTVNDMLKFVAANLDPDDSALARALRQTHRPRENFRGDQMKVGLGWLVLEANDSKIHWHNGGTGGYHSFAGFDAERGRGVVVLSNCTNSIDDIGFHLLNPEFELARQEPAKMIDDVPDSPAGRALGEWIETTRSGEIEAARAHYESGFTDAFKSSVPLQPYLAFRWQVRGMLQEAELKQIVVHSEHDLSAYAQAGDGEWIAIHVQVMEQKPHLIQGLFVRPESPPAKAAAP